MTFQTSLHTTPMETKPSKLGHSKVVLPRTESLCGKPHYSDARPVSKDARKLSNYIDEFSNRRRISYIDVFSIINRSRKTEADDKKLFHEYPASKKHLPTIPMPDVVIDIVGKDYDRSQDSKDNFFVRFGALALSNHRHMLRYEPYAIGKGKYGADEAARQTTIQELFGPEAMEEIESLATVNLGTIDHRQGHLTQIRSFNRKPFGIPIVQIIDQASMPSRNLDFRLRDQLIIENPN